MEEGKGTDFLEWRGLQVLRKAGLSASLPGAKIDKTSSSHSLTVIGEEVKVVNTHENAHGGCGARSY